MDNQPGTTAFIFPGQGSQFVGMGKDLADAFPIVEETFLEANAILGFKITDIAWHGSTEELNDTANTQPALFVHSIAAFRLFRSILPEFLPVLMAGHSLGQFSAMTAAGVLSFADGLSLVAIRGELMKRAGLINPGGMAAILGMDISTLDRVCAEVSNAVEVVQVANDNCPGQIVISGHKDALERAMQAAKAAGAKRALPLAVSIAAHSPLMDSIHAEWLQAANSVEFKDSTVPVIGNVSSLPLREASKFRKEIIDQMNSRVRWTESVNWMVKQGVKSFFEIGPGSVLSGLVKRITTDSTTLTFGQPGDFDVLK